MICIGEDVLGIVIVILLSRLIYNICVEEGVVGLVRAIGITIASILVLLLLILSVFFIAIVCLYIHAYFNPYIPPPSIPFEESYQWALDQLAASILRNNITCFF